VARIRLTRIVTDGGLLGTVTTFTLDRISGGANRRVLRTKL
jgi:hypothetical protein